VKFFGSAEGVISYLLTTKDKPFLIISDVNLPEANGFELRRKIFENYYLREKSIPFVFLSTSAHPGAVTSAYNMMVQGFFQKPSDFTLFKMLIKSIIDYWEGCEHPTLN
jgi:DNA-binding NarL/FixJ family response regulator